MRKFSKHLKSALALAMMLIMSISSPMASFAQGLGVDAILEIAESNDIVIHYETVDDDGVVDVQVSEFGESLFTLRRTDEYIYSSQLTPLGYYTFAFAYTGSYEILAGTINVSELIATFPTQLAQDISSRINVEPYQVMFSFSDVIIENINVLYTDVIVKDVIYHDFESTYLDYTSVFVVPLFGGPPYSSMNALISAEFPPMGPRLTSTTQSTRNGRTVWARSYEVFSVSHNTVRTVRIAALTAVAIASVALGGIPATAIVKIAAFALGSIGALVAISDFMAGEIHVIAHHDRRVNVDNMLQIRGVRDIRHNAISGPLGFALDVTRHTVVSSFGISDDEFRHNSIFLQRGTETFWANQRF